MTSPQQLVLCDFPTQAPGPTWPSHSPFVLEVEYALRFARLTFEHRRMSVFKIKEVNPTGQLPVLLIDGEPVADSTVILHRIDERLAPGSLTRGLDATRVAEAWLWEEFSDTALYPQVLATRWADDRGWPVPRDAFFTEVPALLRGLVASFVRKKTLQGLQARDFTRAGLGACEARLFRVLDHLEARAPETGFWLGEAVSVADIGLFAHLHSMRLPQLAFRAEQIAKRARLSRWLDRVEAAAPRDTRAASEAAATA